MDSLPPAFARRTFLTGATALLAAGASGAAAAADLPVVNAGTIPSDVAALLTYAAERDYYRNNGLDVNVQLLASGPVIVNAVIGGSLDVGAANIGSLIVARSKGIPLKVIAPVGLADASSVGDVIAVRKDSPIQSGADLNGKTVGIIAIKTMQYAAVELWIDKHGGDSKSVKFIEISPSDMGPALENRRVDAIIPNEPITTLLRPSVRVIGNQWGSLKLPLVVFAVFATESWLQKNPETATRFTTALRQAAIWANGHRRDTAAMLIRQTKLEPQLAASMGRSTYGTRLETAMIQPNVDNLVRYGLLDKPIDLNELIWHGPGRG